jgi:hypothetical protein
MNLDNITLSSVSQTQENKYVEFQNTEITEADSRGAVTDA